MGGFSNNLATDLGPILESLKKSSKQANFIGWTQIGLALSMLLLVGFQVYLQFWGN